MTTVKQIIKDIASAYDTTLDVSDSSSLTDLLINPASAMMDPFITQLNYLLNNLGLLDPESINPSELDAIGSNFLISRVQGTKGTGYVELLYTVPQSISIPLGAKFTSSTGIDFVTTHSMYVSADTMQGNAWNYPYYSSGPVPVEATDTGTSTAIGINQINSTDMDPAPDSVTNPAAFSGGTGTESNTDYVNRIINEIVSGALGSAQSVRTILRKTFPTVVDTLVRGMNDNEMLRDLVTSGLSLSSVHKVIDFYGKISGLNELPHPESQAYYTVFWDDPTTSGIQPDLPGIQYFSNEFTTSMYEGMYALNDSLQATAQTLIVLEDNFGGGTLNPRWTLSDGTVGIGQLLAPGESALDTVGGLPQIRLGYEYTGNTALTNMPITVSALFLFSVLNYLARSTQLPASASSWYTPIKTYADFLTFLTYLDQNTKIEDRSNEFAQMMKEVSNQIVPETSNNYFPIASAPLPMHNGVVLTGTLQSSDQSTEGRMSYVTVLRDSASLDPANGYGFAWMVGDGSKYNVYLVDNSALANDLFINDENVVNPQGENAWKAATRLTLVKNISYSYELTIGIDYSMSLKIWQTGNSKPGTPTVSCGAPLGHPSATGTNIGFGVLGTHNYRWWYGGINVTTTTGVHTAALFQLKAHPADFPDNSSVTIDYYGYGNDGGSNNGLSAFIRQKIGGNWTWVAAGTNTSNSGTDRNLTHIAKTFTVTSNFRDTNDAVYLLVTSTYASTAVTEVSTYYVALSGSLLVGVHTGGCADIYITDPTKVLLASNTVTNVAGTVAMSKANGFYIPLHSVIQVQTTIGGQKLLPNVDYVVSSGAGMAYAYSTLENAQLVFNPIWNGFNMTVTYRYYQSGETIQALLDSPENRYTGTSNLAKSIPPAIVSINVLDYRGTASLTTMQNAIAAYVMGVTDTITFSDIINTMYGNGASWIDVANADIEVTQYDYQRIVNDPVQLIASYTLPTTLSAFFADATSLNALRRL